MNNNLYYLEQELLDVMRSDASLFAFFQDHVFSGVWFWDLENPENEWMDNKFWTHLGYSPSEMPNSPSAWMDKIHPEDAKIARQLIEGHIQNPKEPYSQVIRYFHKDGSTRFINCTGKVILNKEGRPWRMLGVHIDITSEREHQSELEKSTVYLESLFRSIPDLIFVINKEGLIIDFKGDSSTERLLVSPDEFMGKSLQSLVPEPVAQRLDIALQKMRAGEYSARVDYELTLNGRLLNFSSSITKIEEDKFLIVAREITDIRSEQYISSQLISRMAECVAIIDVKGNLIEVNPPLQQLIGIEKQKLIQENFPFSFLSEADNTRLFEAFQTIVYGGTSELELTLLRPDERSVPTLFKLSTIVDPLGATLRYFATIIDISYKKGVEHRLRLMSERLKSTQRVGRVGYFEMESNSGRWMISEAQKEMLGLEQEEFIGHEKWMELIEPDFVKAISEKVKDSFVNLTPLHVEFPVRVKKTDELIWLEVRGEPTLDAETNEITITGYTMDITDKVKYLQSIEARNRRLLEVAWMQSHTVRAPLSRLTALTDAFKENNGDVEKQMFISEEIVKTTHELDEIVRDITQKAEALIQQQQSDDEFKYYSNDNVSDKLQVILVDDDPVVLMLQENSVRMAALDENPLPFEHAEEALKYLVEQDTNKSNESFLILLDINMPNMNGWEFLDRISFELRHLNIFVLMVTSSTNIADKQKANQYYQVIGFIEKVLTKAKVEQIKELVPLRKYYNI